MDIIPNRRVAVSSLARLALLASLALVAGCGEAGGGSGGSGQAASGGRTATGSGEGSALDELLAASKPLTNTSYKWAFEAAGGAVTGGGTVDPKTGDASYHLSAGPAGAAYRTDVLKIGTEYYVKGLPTAAGSGKWLHLDSSKAASVPGLGLQNVTDPGGFDAFRKTVVSVDKTGPRSFKGTLDMTRSAVGSVAASKAILEQLGAKAKAIPFEATLDGKGRIAMFRLTIPAYGTQKENRFELRYSDYGTATGLAAPPAADTAEAPDSIYSTPGG